MASRKSPLFDTATTVGKIMSFLGVSALCGLLAAGLVFPLAATGGAAASAGGDILHEVPAELQEEPLSTPSHMYASDGETRIATFYAENRVPVDLEDVSQEMQDALIAIEDERFYEHGGVDAQGVARAAVHNVTAATQQGASTLTMQYVNNVLNNAAVVSGEGNFLAAGIQEKTYADKLREMKLAVQVEQEMTKDEILEGYMNIVMLGGRNYGVEAAAQYYWGVSASELDHQQAATLAGLVQAPNYFRPDIADNVPAAETRRNTVLRNMYIHDFITEEELEEAIEVDLADTLIESDNEVGCIDAELGNYFCDYVTEDFMQNETFGETPEDRADLLARGGLRIVTTLDPDMQNEAEEIVDDHQPRGEGAAAMLNSMDPENGDILAMAQSTTYDPNEESGAWDSTSMNLNVGESHSGGDGYQGGSILKPFVAGAWVEEGNSMDDDVDADQTEYEYGEPWQASCQPGGSVRLLQGEGDPDVYRISNVLDDTEREMSVDWGLFHSINTATMATANDMDLCAVTDLTDRLGIQGRGAGSDGLSPLTAETPSFVLGSISVTPLVMNRAYAAFANDGTICTPRSILDVSDAHGNEYDLPDADCEQVVDPDVVAQVNDTMINIAEQNLYVGERDGEAPFPMAGKTGTNNNVSGMSFQGYTEGVATSAYVARFNDNDSMWPDGIVEGVTGHSNLPPDSYAGTVAFPLWYDYMREVAPNRATGDFREADDSPFDDRRAGYGERYAMSELGPGDGSDNGDNDDDDDDDD